MGFGSSTVVMARRSEEQAFEVQLALAGFLTGYSGNTRLAYQQDLRQFASWCHDQGLVLEAVRRIDVELFARWLEHRGAARATIGRRLSTVTGPGAVQVVARGCAFALSQMVAGWAP